MKTTQLNVYLQNRNQSKAFLTSSPTVFAMIWVLSVDGEPTLVRSGVKLNVLGGYEIRVADLWLGSHGETPEQYDQICQAGDWRWLRSHSGLFCCLTSLIVNRPQNSPTCQTPQPLKSSQVLLFVVIPLCQVHRKCSVDTCTQLIHLITMNIKRNQCLEHNGH